MELSTKLDNSSLFVGEQKGGRTSPQIGDCLRHTQTTERVTNQDNLGAASIRTGPLNVVL